MSDIPTIPELARELNVLTIDSACIEAALGRTVESYRYSMGHRYDILNTTENVWEIQHESMHCAAGYSERNRRLFLIGHLMTISLDIDTFHEKGMPGLIQDAYYKLFSHFYQLKSGNFIAADFTPIPRLSYAQSLSH